MAGVPAHVVLSFALSAAPTPASHPFAECDALIAARPAEGESYRCFYRVARRQNLFEAAARRLDARLVRDPGNDWIRLSLGSVELDRSRDRAEPLFRAAAEGFSRREQTEGEVHARLNLSGFLVRRGRMPESDAELASALRLAEGSGDKLLLASVRAELARQLWRKGEDLGRAYRLAREAETQLFPEGRYEAKVACLHALGGLSTDLGRGEESLGHFRRLTQLSREEGDRFTEAMARANTLLRLLDGHDAAGEPPSEETVQFARDALATAIAAGNRLITAGMHRYLGELSKGSDRLRHHEEGLRIARELKDVKLTGRCLRGLAEHLVADNPARALRVIQEAQQLARRHGDRWELAQAWFVRAHLRWETGSREAAIADSFAQIEAVEAIRDLQPDDQARASLLSNAVFAYHRLAGRLLEPPGVPPAVEPFQSQPSPEDIELAFAVTERMRARVLLEALDLAQATPLPEGPLAERRQEVLARIAQVQRRLTGPGLGEAARSFAVHELDALESQEAELRSELAKQNPGFASLRRAASPRLQDMREALADDEALLAFQLGERFRPGNFYEGGSWVWAHTRADTRVYPIPDRHRMEPAVGLFLGLFERRDGSEAAPAASLYHDLLEEPLRDLPTGVRRLVIVGDGALHRIPFAALREDRDGEPLIARYQLSGAPSVALWLRWRRDQAGEADRPALVLADPELPAPAAAAAQERGWALAVAAQPGGLPHARREGRHVVRSLGGDSQLLLGAQATEHFIKHEPLGRFALLHFAAHTVLDEERPERSAILLAPGAAEEDGLLQIREVVGLDVRGRAVVLSACRSASGTVLASEGVLGLARAFFQAGARAVVGSLWPLRDDEAEPLFAAFYERLAEGRSIADALAEASRARLRSGAPAAAWAGIVLLGDGTAVPLPGGRPSFPRGGWMALVAALTLAGFSWLLVRHRARRPPHLSSR